MATNHPPAQFEALRRVARALVARPLTSDRRRTRDYNAAHRLVTDLLRRAEVAEVRAATRWWRERNPAHASARVRDHGWYGRVLWSTAGDAGPVALLSEVLSAYRSREGFSIDAASTS